MERPLLHRLLSCWLALLVLTSSVGLTVQQHTCRQSGHRSASVVFSPARHGCPPVQARQHNLKQAGPTKLTASCCEFGAHFHKLDAPSAELSWLKVPAPAVMPEWPAPIMWAAHPAPARLAGPQGWHAADSSPPPRAGRQLLTFVGVLVV